MPKHENKYCPRCQKAFNCKVGSITLCQCWTVPLNEEELQFIHEKYNNCLCAACMLEEKHLLHQQEFDKKLRKLGNQFK